MVNLWLKKKFDLWIGGTGITLVYLPVRALGLLLKRNHSLLAPEHLAVVKILGGGSLLMIYPFLATFRKQNPQTKITLICGRSIKNFAEIYQIFDHIQIIDDRSPWTFLRSGLAAFAYLFRNVDVTLDLEIHSRITTLLTTLAMVKNRVGLIDNSSLWRKRIYTHSIFVASAGTLSAAYDTTIPLFGLKGLNLIEVRNKFCEQISREIVPVKLQATPKKYISVGMGCSDLAFERQLQISAWAELLQMVHKKYPDLHFCFLGGPGDKHLAMKALEMAPELAANSVILCGDISLGASLRAVQMSSTFIGIDSALIHLARTLGTPSISFWGPTSPDALLRDWPQQELKIFSRMHCSPCVHQTEAPPCGGKNVCMRHQDKFDQVLDFVEQIIHLESINSVGTRTSLRTTWAYIPKQEALQQYSYEVTQ